MKRIAAIRSIRDDLLNGNVSIGSWMQVPHASVAEIIGQAGYDWIAIDMEHGAVSHHQMPDLCRALELGNTLPLARIAEGRAMECKQALDAGVGGVIVPMVETAEQLMLVREACRWPPAGTRGVGFSRANLFGEHFETYSIESQEPLLVAMIESGKALDNLDSILSVDGLDAIMVGPYDLSASLNLTAKFDHPEFVESMHKIVKMASQANIAAGLHVVEPSKMELDKCLSEGYRFIAYSIDSVFMRKSFRNPLENL